MELGDFTKLAKDYVNRVGYSETVLRVLKSYIEAQNGDIKAVADVGAGTGKLTQDLETLGLCGYAVEPNDAMRAEGIKLFNGKDTFAWSKGLAVASLENAPSGFVSEQAYSIQGIYVYCPEDAGIPLPDPQKAAEQPPQKKGRER